MLTGVIDLPDHLFHRPDPLFECFDVAVNAGKIMLLEDIRGAPQNSLSSWSPRLRLEVSTWVQPRTSGCAYLRDRIELTLYPERRAVRATLIRHFGCIT